MNGSNTNSAQCFCPMSQTGSAKFLHGPDLGGRPVSVHGVGTVVVRFSVQGGHGGRLIWLYDRGMIQCLRGGTAGAYFSQVVGGLI